MEIIRVVHGIIREAHKSLTRSGHWPTVRKNHLKNNSVCAACGGHKLLQVHHILPFHEKPELELDLNNLITLCTVKLCHVDLGHGGDYKHYCPSIKEICNKIRSKQITRKVAIKLAMNNRLLNDGDDTT